MTHFHKLIKNGKIYDGSGNEPVIGDVGIIDDKIRSIGLLESSTADETIDATGLMVAPGFINVLSWAVESLIEDGRSLGGLHQGVTLEVFGEGWSMGPLTEEMKNDVTNLFNSEIEYDVTWSTLGGYLEFLENKGISTNIASFVGATTLRIYTIGHDDRDPTEKEMEIMKTLVEEAMEEGALGIGSSMIYAPAFFAKIEEIIELCKVAASYGGMYITHMRSEGDTIHDAVTEVITIAREAKIAAEIYHLKLSGEQNWGRLDEIIYIIDSAREDGLKITTDMYLYTAGGTGLQASLPPHVLDGGSGAMIERLSNSDARSKIIQEMKTPSKDWENLYLAAGPGKIIVSSVKEPELKQYIGQSIAEIAEGWGKSVENTVCDLIIQSSGWIGCIYFIINEDNIRKQLQLPYMSFGSDAASMAPEGVFLKSSTHPRAYGNVPKLLSKYVRDEKLITLEEAIYKLTYLPASNLKIKNRGLLKEGYFADIVVFDFDKMKDLATYEHPHQLSEGIKYVIVNGSTVIENGKHTGNFPGRFIKGPGYNVSGN